MNTNYLRSRYGLTQEDLSIIFDIPKRTITNWDNRNCMPDYVYKMMCELLVHYEAYGLDNVLASRKALKESKKPV